MADPVIIEHTIHREGGSLHTIDGMGYHFKANELGAHVCQVSKAKHIDRFLQIPTFRLYLEERYTDPDYEDDDTPDDTEQGDDGVELLDESDTLQPVYHEPPDLDSVIDEDGNSTFEKNDEAQDDDDTQDEISLDDMDDDQLRNTYKDVVGKAAGNRGRAKMIEDIVKAQEDVVADEG